MTSRSIPTPARKPQAATHRDLCRSLDACRAKCGEALIDGKIELALTYSAMANRVRQQIAENQRRTVMPQDELPPGSLRG